MWQQSGRLERMVFEDAKNWITERNKNKFADFNDWRLPKLEEAMSLMEPKKNGDGLYIVSKFEKSQSAICTADPMIGESWA